MSREERDAELASLKDAKAMKAKMFTPDGKLISQFTPKSDDATRQKEKETADLAKIPQTKKVKASLFTADGKLISQTPGSTAPPKTDIAADMAALKANKVTQSSMFAEASQTKDESPELLITETQMPVEPTIEPPTAEPNNNPAMVTPDTNRMKASIMSSIVYEVIPMQPAVTTKVEPMMVNPSGSEPLATNNSTESAAAPHVESMIPVEPRVESHMEPGAEPKVEPPAVAPLVETSVAEPTKEAMFATTVSTVGKTKVESPPVVVETKSNMPATKTLISMRNLADEFDDILDGAAFTQSADELLGWSFDADSGNMTDWTIIIHNQDDDVPVSYHVHRLVLSTGPTKSEFFENLIRSNAASCITEIDLSKSAALAYPQFLDFMYSREDKVDVTTRNAAALRYLGKYFGVRKLVALVTTFVRDDLKPSTSLHYLNAAAEFDDEKLMTTAAQLCAQNISTRDVDREGLTSLDPPLFSMVVSFPKVACSSGELSKFVAEFARKHDDEMNVALLDVVTDNKNMPTIDPCEAVYLLQLSEKHDDMSDLRDRCIKSCAIAWHRTLVSHVEHAPDDDDPYDIISAPLKAVLLEKALLQAHADFSDIEKSMDSASEAESKLLASKDELIAARDKKIMEMQYAASQQMEQYAKLQGELARFKRVPCEHDFPKKRDCTFHKDAAGSKKTPYGKTKPSKMPVHSTAIDLEGYLFGSGSNLLPVYYYNGS